MTHPPDRLYSSTPQEFQQSRAFTLDAGSGVQSVPTAPFYLLFDVSYSMINEIGALNQALRELKNEMLKSPLLADIARVSLITFSDHADVVIPMQDLATDTRIGPGDILQVQGGTSFANAFRALKARIDTDVAALKSQPNATVYRPMVFFVTDGYPNESEAEWQQAFNELTTARAHPNIIPFGFGDANSDTLKKTTFPVKRNEAFYFISKQGISRGESIAAIAQIVVQSVVSSTQSAADGEPRVILEKAGTEATLTQAPAWDTL